MEKHYDTNCKLRSGFYFPDAEEFEEMCEFMDNNPSCLSKYIDRHPYLLDAYVKMNCDEHQVEQWLKAVAEPAPCKLELYFNPILTLVMVSNHSHLEDKFY